MSDTDGFIDEVNEEVRRDRFYHMLRRYGWIAGVAIAVIVGGASYSEYRKAQSRAQAEALGDAMLSSLALNDEGDRVAALAQIDAGTPETMAVRDLLKAGQQVAAEDTAGAIETLKGLAINGEVPLIYRQVAQFKSVTLQTDITPAADRRLALDAMTQPGHPLRLLALEQVALIDLAEGATDAAVEGYQSILSDAQVTAGLQQRALQAIVALGGTPELGRAGGPQLGQAASVDE